jgi:hypothetical protein
MRSVSVFAIVPAVVLALASTTTLAQDKPSSASANKPMTTLSKHAKPAVSVAAPVNSVGTKAPGQSASKQSAPERSTPVGDRSYDGCQGKDSDA